MWILLSEDKCVGSPPTVNDLRLGRHVEVKRSIAWTPVVQEQEAVNFELKINGYVKFIGM